MQAGTMVGYDRLVTEETGVTVVPEGATTGREDPVTPTGDTSVALLGEEPAGVSAAGTPLVWVRVIAWLVVKTDVWVSVMGQIVVLTATTTVVVAAVPDLAGQSVTVGAQLVMVWYEVE